MAYDAKAIEIMIASPSDVKEERQIVRNVIAEWNAVHSRKQGVCLMPLGWETHSSPELSAPAQDLINERVLKHADILVGIFWTRVGSPTGKSISGSIEEIERHRAEGKPVMLYFSTVPVVPSTSNTSQLEPLEEFRSWALTQGLVETYEDHADFANKFRHQLQIHLQENEYIASIMPSTAAHSSETVSAFSQLAQATSGVLSRDAQELLVEAASSDGTIMVVRSMGGTSISAGAREFAVEGDRRSEARWTAAAQDLYRLGLAQDINGKGEIFELSHRGYEAADKLQSGSA